MAGKDTGNQGVIYLDFMARQLTSRASVFTPYPTTIAIGLIVP